MGVPTGKVFVLQNAATANGNGLNMPAVGETSNILFEVQESAGGTATLTINGSFDGTSWYVIGYQKINATASPARAVTGISVTANLKAVYQALDYYPMYQAVISSISAATVLVRAYMVAP
jgi:hypothetical protein